VAILSPHPLGATQRTSLGPRGSGRVALQVSVRVGGRTVEVVAVHFNTALPRPIREVAWRHPRSHMQVAAAVRVEQTDALLRMVQAARPPLVVGGDFNSPPGSQADRRLGRLLQNAFAAGGAGFGWSFRSPPPRLRIDYLFVSHDLRVLNCRVLPLLASDHRPVVADLAWQ